MVDTIRCTRSILYYIKTSIYRTLLLKGGVNANDASHYMYNIMYHRKYVDI